MFLSKDVCGESSGMTRQAGFLPEPNILHSCFSFKNWKWLVGAPEGPQTRPAGQMGIALCNQDVLEMSRQLS